ncbi:MAG: hypothetical protein ICV83_29310 [Cytophagales bacterium]|nr:hypothetical protein [Cytophagales bacterium]
MGSYQTHACFRLKSERRRIRLRKKDQEKHLLRLHREENKLHRQIRDLGYEPLIPPVQKGYKRIFVLRDDVQRSKQAAFFTALLSKINTVQYSDTKAFTQKKRRRGRKIHVPREQKLLALNEWEWRQEGFTVAEAAYFYPVPEWKYGRLCTVYQFREPWRFVLRVVPNLITEVRITDNLLEQRLDEIDSYLSCNDRRERLNWLLGKYVNYRWYKRERAKYENPFRNRPFQAMLDE